MWKYLSLLILTACSVSPLMTGIEAEANRYYFSQIYKGMTMKEVYHLMGRPFWWEIVDTEDGCYEVWYYIIERTDMTQQKVQNRNLKPLFFKDEVLQGWGYSYYFRMKDRIKARKPQVGPPPATTEITPPPPAEAPVQGPSLPKG